MQTKSRSENIKGRVIMGDLGLDERILLKWNLKKLSVSAWTILLWSINIYFCVYEEEM
jgi:hypothetical protein